MVELVPQGTSEESLVFKVSFSQTWQVSQKVSKSVKKCLFSARQNDVVEKGPQGPFEESALVLRGKAAKGRRWRPRRADKAAEKSEKSAEK